MSPHRQSPAVLVAMTAVLALGACARSIAGEPRPVAHSSTATTQAGAGSIGEIDLCTLLTLDDLPVKPGPGARAEQRSDPNRTVCTNSVQLPSSFKTLAATIGRWPVPFRYFVPPASGVGDYVEIDGRPAWVGHDRPGGTTTCAATFGSAGVLLTVSVTDWTERGVDSCDTATELAEIVIARTPPPDEP